MFKTLCLAVATATLLTGCAMTGQNSRTGFAIVNMQTEGGGATGHSQMDKEGVACSQNYLGFFATGDSSISKAMENGGISTVATVDFSYLQILNFYGEVCTGAVHFCAHAVMTAA